MSIEQLDLLLCDTYQMDAWFPLGWKWKKELENLARIYSVEEGKTITFLDLMRRGIQEKYQLGENYGSKNDE